MTNQELAIALRDMRDFLIIAGYEESHATRYSHISRYIEKMGEDVNVLRAEGRLGEIPGVGKLVQTYIKQFLDTGTCEKIDEWLKEAPWSVLEVVRIPGVGPKTVRGLYRSFGISSLETLRKALDDGVLDDVPGIGPKTLATMRAHVS